MDTKVDIDASTPLIPSAQSSLSSSSSPKLLKSLLSRLKSASGFTKTSNLLLFLCTAGLFLVFSLERTRIFNPSFWKAYSVPGEWYWFKDGYLHAAIRLHHWVVVPAGILFPMQFLPRMRRYSRFHRISGRLLVMLLIIGNITACIVAPYAFTGTIATITAVYSLMILTTTCLYKSYRGILDHKIDVHRAYMIRVWGYTGSILTMRVIMPLLSKAITQFAYDSYYSTYTCRQLDDMYTPYNLSTDALLTRYPLCKLEGNEEVLQIVPARFSAAREEVGSVLGITFGVAVWMAILLNVLCTEIYLNYTPDEDERLKKASEIRRRVRCVKSE